MSLSFSHKTTSWKSKDPLNKSKGSWKVRLEGYQLSDCLLETKQNLRWFLILGWLVVEPTHLKNHSQNGFIFPKQRWVNIKKYLKPPPSGWFWENHPRQSIHNHFESLIMSRWWFGVANTMLIPNESHSIHVWYIYLLHLPSRSTKCR